MTTTTTPVAKLDLPLGTPVPYSVARDGEDIGEWVQVTRWPTQFHISVWLGVTTVDGWVANFGDETEMRTEVRRAIKAIRAYGGTEQIRRRREDLVFARHGLVQRQLRGFGGTDAIREIDVELEFTEPIGDRQGRLKMAADFDARYGVAA